MSLMALCGQRVYTYVHISVFSLLLFRICWQIFSRASHTHAHALICVCARARARMNAPAIMCGFNLELICTFWHHVIILSIAIPNPRHMTVTWLVYSSRLLKIWGSLEYTPQISYSLCEISPTITLHYQPMQSTNTLYRFYAQFLINLLQVLCFST